MGKWNDYWNNQAGQIQQGLVQWRNTGHARVPLFSFPPSNRKDLLSCVTVDINGPCSSVSGKQHMLDLARSISPLLNPNEIVRVCIKYNGNYYLEFIGKNILERISTGNYKLLKNQTPPGNEKPLEVLEPQDIRIWCESLRNDITEKFKIYPNIVKIANQVFQKINSSRIINVHLYLPEHISQGIRNGRYTLDKFKGIVREEKTGRAVKWLEEAKIGKNLAKAKMIANVFVFAVDIFERHIINENLRKILRIAEDIDRKLDAQQYGKLEAAFALIREIQDIPNSPENSKKRLDAHKSLLELKSTYIKYATEIQKDIREQAIKFVKGKGIFKGSLKNLSESLKKFSNVWQFAHAAHVGVCMTFSDEEESLLIQENMQYIKQCESFFHQNSILFGNKFFNKLKEGEKREQFYDLYEKNSQIMQISVLQGLQMIGKGGTE